MEAAARLAVWADIDIRMLDAFCVCLLGEDDVLHHEPPPAGNKDVSVLVSVDAPTMVGSLQKRNLREWLLALACELIDPRTKVLKKMHRKF